MDEWLKAALRVAEAAKDDHRRVPFTRFVGPLGNEQREDCSRCICGREACPVLDALEALEGVPSPQ